MFFQREREVLEDMAFDVSHCTLCRIDFLSMDFHLWLGMGCSVRLIRSECCHWNRRKSGLVDAMDGASVESSIVLDVGNLFTRVGFCEYQKTSPDHVFRSQEAEIVADCRDDGSACSVISDSGITDWDRFENIIKYALGTKNKTKHCDHPLMMIEKPGLEPRCRRKMVELAFEGLDVPSFFLASEPVMALYSVGLTSGVVLSSSYMSSNVSTVHDGHRPPYGVVHLGFGGQDVTQYTRDLMKEELGKEVSDEEAEQFKFRHGHFKTKNRTCNLGCEKFEKIGQNVAEYVLNPKGDCLGFHKAIPRCIYLTDEEDDYEPVYFRNIVLCGGNTLFPGIKERLEKEVETPDYLTCGVRVIAPSFRQHAAWVGGSIGACLPTFKSFWITREDYQDHGENILSRKCLPY